MAPRIRSSHMNQKRYWPGVPNKYSTRSSARLIRPKSIATVVVDFIGMPVRLSMPALALVTNASVRSGTISETAPTNVVLPTPKPPRSEERRVGEEWRERGGGDQSTKEEGRTYG